MRILITGAGGSSAVSIWKSLSAHALFMADIDPCASGLYLVPEKRRFLLPRGDNPGFVRALLELCLKRKIELLIPTVDSELLPVALARSRFEKQGVKVALPGAGTLRLCRDKYALITRLRTHVPTPDTVLLNPGSFARLKKFPVFVKPRIGAGSRGTLIARNKADLHNLPKNGTLMIQEYLPGEEYSVDTYVRADGTLIAAVPRERLKTDSGIAVTARTVHLPEAIGIATRILNKIRIRYVANIQLKRSSDGVLKLLEINPRFPGTMPLTAEAGIDLPRLLVKEITGNSLPSQLLPFREVAMIRYWTEHYFAPGEMKQICPL